MQEILKSEDDGMRNPPTPLLASLHYIAICLEQGHQQYNGFDL
jgi:hypothetical protein